MNCYAGQMEGVIYPNGDVAFCEFVKPVGNLRKQNYDLKGIWRSERAEKYRRLTKDCACIHGCNLKSAIQCEEEYVYQVLRKRSFTKNLKRFIDFFLDMALTLKTYIRFGGLKKSEI
ncbi:hypothetical protein AKJ65_06125 [candidate division MSBL1 archaeon SCGC-AAA259E19]|uniref:4Fe4S-binding SPASM domain-containing protein n=1 Tax=candidate division MSBL1 archaeon SCGC-AAA259E19 TaxID=1698264 RepID=A0A133UHQ0_9EURY|nr:hypothetical protein AKJ65_06125 [candidate division MSBL1 archaeon SCGC-AAA259E19]